MKLRLLNLESKISARFKEHENELKEIRFLIHQLEQPSKIGSHKQAIGFRPRKG